MRLFSCTPFYKELDLLKLRCEELSSLPTTHVLVESTLTHSGKPKPLYFQENLQLFKKYNVRHGIINDGIDRGPMGNENHHRDQLIWGLYDAQDDDIILITDLDEIPRASVIKEYMDRPEHLHLRLEMQNYGFWLNCDCGSTWDRAAILPFKALKQTTPQGVRDAGGEVIRNAGWHFQWQGGIDAVMDKFSAFCHQEPGVQQHANREVLEEKIRTGQSIWGSDFWAYKGIDATFPKYLQEHPEEFEHMIS